MKEKRYQRTEKVAERMLDLDEKCFELEAKYRVEQSRVERVESEEEREERWAMIELMCYFTQFRRS